MHAPVIRGREERKVVSVLFVDLVGFTARSHEADPEDVQAALAPYHALLKREIERFGGTVEKFIGDAVMAVFGVPKAHEDDAERAVRAALRITDAISELNKGTTLDLSIRAAVNTGEGLVTLSARPESGEHFLTGDVANTASRLQGVAPVNGVAVGEHTHRATQAVIDYQELEPVALKGKPAPVRLWQALGAKSRLGAEAEGGYTTPFIGRELDLGILKQTYQRMLRESSVQLVTIAGEPGVGKTRLVSQFATYIDDAPELVSWRLGRCLPYGEAITFWAWGEIIKSHAGILESDSAEQATAKLAAAIASVIDEESERPWFQARLGALVGATTPGGGAAKEESFTAWRRFLEAIAATGPLVVVFEDLHWADPPLLEFIEHLVEWATDVRLMVVCTARPELHEKHPSWAGGLRNATTISLSPLSDTETAQLVAALLSQAVLPAEVHAALLERAGGNPLYAEEFVRMLSDRGALRRRGRVVSFDPGTDIAMPDSVQALIAARLDTLSPQRKALLHDAAVAGKVFWSGAVATIAEVPEEEVTRGLHELSRKEIVRPARTSSMAGESEYSFWHGLIKDVSYSQIPRAARVQKHRAMATWIEERAGDRLSDHAEVLAHHYTEAVNLAAAAGDAAASKELEPHARRHLIAAGDRAAELDVAAAEAHYARALKLLPTGHPERAQVLIKAGIMAHFRGQLDEAARHLEDAVSEARSGGNRLGEGHATARLAVVEWFRGRTEHCAELSTKAFELLEGERPGPELAYAYLRLADNADQSGDSAKHLELAEKATLLAEQLGDQRRLLDAQTTRGVARCALGDLGGLDDLRQAVERGLELGLGDPCSYAYSALCEWTWWEEGPTAGNDNYRKAIEFMEHRGMIGDAAFAKAESLRVLFDLGRWDELCDLADELLNQPDPSPYIEAIALTAKAGVVVAREELAQGDELTQRLLPLARSIQDLQVLVPALAVTSLLAWSQGDVVTATRLMAELEEMTRGTRWRAHNLPQLARILLAAGEVERILQLLSNLAAATTRDRNSAVTAEALLAEARGDRPQALARYEDAAQRWGDFGFVLEHAHGLFGVARCLLVMNRGYEAIPKLNEARDLFAQLKARPSVMEVDRYLAEGEALTS